MMQRPEATRVASYDTWKTLKRQVQKGERGIKIFYPMLRQLPYVDPDTGEKSIEKKLIGFGLGNVFDVSQTQGEPLPEPPLVPILYSDAGGELFQRLNLVAHREGLTVRKIASDHPNPDIMGWYEPTNNLIALRDDVSMLQKTKTLAHELGHHFHGPVNLLFASREERETIAESVSYVTLARFGLDSGERSFPYIATWAKDQEQLRRALGQIQRVSGTLIGKIDQTGHTPLPYYQRPQVVAERPYA